MRDILRSYRIERKTEETHTESAVGDSDRGEVVPATTLDTIVGDEAGVESNVVVEGWGGENSWLGVGLLKWTSSK